MKLTTDQGMDTTEVQFSEVMIYIRVTYRDMGDGSLTGVEKISRMLYH